MNAQLENKFGMYLSVNNYLTKRSGELADHPKIAPLHILLKTAIEDIAILYGATTGDNTGFAVQKAIERNNLEQAILKLGKALPAMRSIKTIIHHNSPNSNIIERLWRFFKKKTTHNKYYEKIAIFKKACLDFFKNIGQYKDELYSWMTDNFQVVQA